MYRVAVLLTLNAFKPNQTAQKFDFNPLLYMNTFTIDGKYKG
jgi:hypothetical protein